MTESPATVDHPGKIAQIDSSGFFPADFAAIENGKVYTCGAFWSTLRFSAFPAVLPSMSLVAVIRMPFHANYADHTFQVTLIDQDERLAGLQVEGSFRSAPTIEHKYGAPGQSPVAIPIHGLTIERPGEYSFRLFIDGKEVARYPFSVVQIASIAIQPTPNSA